MLGALSLRLIAVVGAIGMCAKAADAIPVLANGQRGVSCEQCHNAPPNLNAYGRYILATNFTKGLDPHAQMQENLRDPVSLEVAVNGSNDPDPTLPKTYAGTIALLSAGYLGTKFTYYASVPIVDGGFPASSVDQLWVAYNGLSGGNGSLQAGKFPTPIFAPWVSQSLSLAGYSLAAMPVGLNAVGVGDNRWGASYSQIGSGGLVGNVAYLSNTGTVERAYNGNVNDAAAGAEGQSVAGSLEFVNPGSHFTGGVGVLAGGFPLPSGANDSFSRQMALLAYSPSSKYELNVMALVGHDNNPNDGATRASSSNGTSYEAIYNPAGWLHLDLRYEHTNDGLGTVGNNYITDLAFNLVPNLVLTLENVSSVGMRPVMSYQLLYAGPWLRTPRTVKPKVAGALESGRKVYVANCSACHGASGAGGEGPKLQGLAAEKTAAQTVAIIESPAGIMPHLYPGTLSESDVNDVTAYIRGTFK